MRVISTALHLLRLRPGMLTLYEQLCLEEALLRTDTRSWCIINHGAPSPMIVMGISGKLHQLVDVEAARARCVPVLRRYTGGGTVVTDEGTVYVSLILNKAEAAGAPEYPRDIMRWSEQLYAPVFAGALRKGGASGGAAGGGSAADGFRLWEHDYCVGDRKIGGNAQSVSRSRWVHHTSFLWDFREEHMALLSLPDKRPAYRGDRAHGSFLSRLKDCWGGGAGAAGAGYGAGAHLLPDALEAHLRGGAAAGVVEAGLEDVRALAAAGREHPEYRHTNTWVPLQ